LTVDIEFGIKVLALAFMRDKPVETWTRLIVLFSHMPFADISRVVASRLQDHREALKARWILSEVVHDPMLVRVEAAQNARSTRRAKRRRTEHIFEVDTFLPKPINVRCLHMLVARKAYRIPSKVIREHKQDIRFGVGNCGQSANQPKYGRDQGNFHFLLIFQASDTT
jgi:hypothetical protein